MVDLTTALKFYACQMRTFYKCSVHFACGIHVGRQTDHQCFVHLINMPIIHYAYVNIHYPLCYGSHNNM